MTPVSPSLDDRLDQAAAAQDPRAAVSFVLREAYDAARTRVERKLDAGLKGREVARLYAAAADEMLAGPVAGGDRRCCFRFRWSRANGCRLWRWGVTAGGVLAPFSDLDLLFLRPARATPRGESVVEFVLYVLWDLGVKVGPSVRSVEECLSLSRTDMTVRTTLLEARPLAGVARCGAAFAGFFRVVRACAGPGGGGALCGSGRQGLAEGGDPR